MVTSSIYLMKRKGKSDLSPDPLPFSFPPYALPLSTPAAQDSEFFIFFLCHFELLRHN